jgi:hypothetical protein
MIYWYVEDCLLLKGTGRFMKADWGLSADLHLVACVKAKADRPMAAADLYQSAWFKKARAFVEKREAPWYILSAEYGLVRPDEIIKPYDKTLLKMSAEERRSWGNRVICQLNARGHDGDVKIVVLAGQKYREPISEWLGQRAVVPMQGLGIGRQLAWLTIMA